MKPHPLPSPEAKPISIAVQLLIADSRDVSRFIEVGSDELAGGQPESLAALPGRLHAIFQAVEKDAQRELSQLLAELIAPTPPPAAPVSQPAVRLMASAKGIQLLTEDPAAQTLMPDDYLAPLNLPLLDDALVLLPPVIEGNSVVP